MASVPAPDDLTVPERDLARQAVASLRGYAYQVWAAALAWVDLRGDEVLLLEVAEDFAVLSTNALALSQSKDTAGSGSVTLRTRGVVDAINSFWRFQEANPERAVRLHYLTTSAAGQEQGAAFPKGRPGLQAWREGARDGADITATRSLLRTLDLEPGLADWLHTASDQDVRDRLLRRVHWEYARPGLEKLEDLLKERLVLLGEPQGVPASLAMGSLHDVLLADILRASVSPDATVRRRDRAQLLVLMERATSVSMPITVVRSGGRTCSASAATALLEPIDAIPSGPWTVERRAAVTMIRAALSTGTVWLHGASGAGKTALARQVAHGSNRSWTLLDLRGLTVVDAATRLRAARREMISLIPVGGLVVDDLPAAALSLRSELQLLQTQLALADGTLILTSYREPPPSLAADLGLPTAAVVAAPYFDDAEIRALVTNAGGDADAWALSIRAFCGGGHPQLVAARVAGLRSRGWRCEEMLDDLASGSGPVDVEAEREAVRARLIEELPAAARSLLFRVSLLADAFDRALAISLAGCPPALAEPGAQLDLLVGPWLEGRGRGRLRVSPLVAGSGAKILSDTEQRAVHHALCDDLTARDPFPAEYLPQLLLSGLICGHKRGLTCIVLAVFAGGLSDDDLQSVLFGLPMLRTDRPLFEAEPKLNKRLRLAQLKLACRGDSLKRIELIHARLLREIAGDPEEAVLRTAAAFFILGTEHADIPVAKWFPLLDDMERGPKLEVPPAASGSGRDPDPLTAMLGTRAGRIRTLDEVEALFDALSSVAPERRRRLLDEPAAGISMRAIILNAGWLQPSRAPDYDGRAAATRYAALQFQAQTWGDEVLALECLCVQAVLLSEYAYDPDGALALLDEAQLRWPDHPRLRRERSKIFLQQNRFTDVYRDKDALLGETSAADRVERAHLTRDVAVSAGATGALAEAVALFEAAAESADGTPAMDEMALGLAADRAFAVWRAGRRHEAVCALRDALLAAETRTLTSERGRYVVRALSFVVRCLHQDMTQPGWDAGQPGSIFGMASRAPPRSDSRPEPNLLTAWYQLEAVEALSGLDVGIAELLEQRTRETKIGTFELIRRNRLHMTALETGGVEAVIAALSDFARCGAHMQQEALNKVELGEEALFACVDRLPWDEPLDLEDPTQRSFAQGALLVSTIFAVARGEAGWLVRLRAAVENDPELRALSASLPADDELLDVHADSDSAVYGALRIFQQAHPAPAPLFAATARVLDWSEQMFLRTEMLRHLGPLVAEKWRFVADQSRFLLRLPTITAPKILQAAEIVEDRPSWARLVLAAADAVRVGLPTSFQDRLRSQANPARAT